MCYSQHKYSLVSLYAQTLVGHDLEGRIWNETILAQAPEVKLHNHWLLKLFLAQDTPGNFFVLKDSLFLQTQSKGPALLAWFQGSYHFIIISLNHKKNTQSECDTLHWLWIICHLYTKHSYLQLSFPESNKALHIKEAKQFFVSVDYKGWTKLCVWKKYKLFTIAKNKKVIGICIFMQHNISFF